MLLLDEPFGALDAKVRVELRNWLRRLHDELHVTSVFVTHDQDEALEVSDYVAVMNQGCVEQVGTPDEVFHRPASSFVMNFLGAVNNFHGRLERGKVVFGNMELDAPEHGDGHGEAALVYIRPHDMEIQNAPDGNPSFKATIVRIHSAGANVRLELTAASGEPLHAEISHQQFQTLHLSPGSEVYVAPRAIRVFNETHTAGRRAASA